MDAVVDAQRALHAALSVLPASAKVGTLQTSVAADLLTSLLGAASGRGAGPVGPVMQRNSQMRALDLAAWRGTRALLYKMRAAGLRIDALCNGGVAPIGEFDEA